MDIKTTKDIWVLFEENHRKIVEKESDAEDCLSFLRDTRYVELEELKQAIISLGSQEGSLMDLYLQLQFPKFCGKCKKEKGEE